MLKTINSYYFQINDLLEENSTPSVNDHPDRQIWLGNRKWQGFYDSGFMNI